MLCENVQELAMSKKLLIILALTITTLTYGESGILFLAHGSVMGGMPMVDHAKSKKMSCDNTMVRPWEKAVLDVVDSIQAKLPHSSEVAFGMWSSMCFNAGVERLEAKLSAQGKILDHLIVLPLFISSHSAVIEMQKYIFKKRDDRLIPIPSVTRINFDGKISYLPAIDYNPQISMILASRFHDLIHKAKEEGLKKNQMELVLVMHGPVGDEDNKKWVDMGEKYIKDVMYLFPVAKAHVVSLRDDAAPEVRELGTAKLRGILTSATANGRKTLVLPLLLSKGGIEQGILDRMEGLEYVWNGEMLLPDTKLRDFLLNRF